MHRLSWFLFLSIFLILSSCFSSRKSAADSKIPIVDPVILQPDTLSLPSAGNDTIEQNLQNRESLPKDSIARISADTIIYKTTDSTGAIQPEEKPATENETARVVTPEIDTVVIIGTGDIMPGTNYPDNRYLPPGNNCARLFDPVREVLMDADVTFGNLEGVFCSEGGTPKKCKDPSVCYVFRMPDEYLDCILDAGYDVLSVANNHVNDFGVEGRVQTAKLLDGAGVPYAGFRSKPFTTFTIDSVKYGFAAFAPHLGTVSLKDYDGAAEIVSHLDSICDIVIVSFHGGAEGKDHQHVPCTDEIYLGYNRGNICKFSHTVVDAGADVVFGHGPHVTRAVELYKDRLICYSLGNFCTYARFNLRGPNGLAPIVKVFTDRQGKFLEGEVISVLQSGEGGPRLDPSNGALGKLKELSKADFPESPLIIEDDGTLRVEAPLPDDVEILNRTFLGNWQRNYYGNEAPDSLNILWEHDLGKGITVIGRKTGSREWAGAGWTGQPLMVREGIDTFLVQGAYDHHLKKINASDGELVWQYKFDDVVKGTGTIWDHTSGTTLNNRWIILQGSRLGTHHYFDAEKIFSYRAISYMTGKELWRHNSKMTESYSRDVDASALIWNDTAYIGLENSYFTLFDPDPEAADSDGDYSYPKIFHQHQLYTGEDVTNHSYNVVTEASPCMIGRMIYVSSGSGHIWGYDMDKKMLTWDFYIGSDMDGSPVVTNDSCIIVTIEKQYIEGRGGMLKLDPSKDPEEAVVWFLPVEDDDKTSWEGGVIGSAGVTDSYNGENFAACMAIDGHLYVVRHDRLSGEQTIGFDGLTMLPTPELVFKYKIGASISTPVFDNEHLLACGYGGIYLFSYKNNDFRLLDTQPFVVEATPFFMNKKIYIASRNGNLYCLGE